MHEINLLMSQINIVFKEIVIKRLMNTKIGVDVQYKAKL